MGYKKYQRRSDALLKKRDSSTDHEQFVEYHSQAIIFLDKELYAKQRSLKKRQRQRFFK